MFREHSVKENCAGLVTLYGCTIKQLLLGGSGFQEERNQAGQGRGQGTGYSLDIGAYLFPFR